MLLILAVVPHKPMRSPVNFVITSTSWQMIVAVPTDIQGMTVNGFIAITSLILDNYFGTSIDAKASFIFSFSGTKIL